MRAAKTIVALAAAAVCAPPAFAADEVTLGIPVVSLTMAPTYIGDEMGYWKSAGLDMKFPYLAGVAVNNALAAGSIDFANSSAPTMIRGNSRDQKTVAIAMTLNRMQIEIVVNKKLADAAGITETSPADKKAEFLRGKKIGVDSINSIVHSFLKFVARKGNVDPDRDITVTNIAGQASLAGLKTGAIDGFTQSLPWTLIPTSEGQAIRLFSGPRGDFPELQPFVNTVILARPGYCDQKPTICQRLVAGFAKSYDYLRDHPKESLEILKKRIPAEIDPAVFAEAFELMRASVPRSPRIEEAAMAKAQDYMLATGMMKPEEKLTNLQDVIYNKFTGN